MTPEQVAEYLQLTTDTIYRLIRRKELAATRIGRHYRVPKADLESFLASHSTRPAVREAMFQRVMAIAERNPNVNSDHVLEELERLDEAHRPGGKGG
jgi:excisionase family DNA binding protein